MMSKLKWSSTIVTLRLVHILEAHANPAIPFDPDLVKSYLCATKDESSLSGTINNANPKIRFFWCCNLLNSIFFKSLPWKHHCVIVARKARSIAVYPGCDVCNNCHGIHLWCRNWRIFLVFRKSRFWRILIVKNQMHVKCQSFPNNAKSWIPIWIIGIFLISSLKLFGLKSWKLCGSI